MTLPRALHRRRPGPPAALPRPTRSRGLTLALAVGGGALAAMTAPAMAAPVTATYRVFVGGVTVLDVDTTLDLTGDRYRITVSAVTGGYLGRLFSWRTESQSDGARSADALRPAHHQQTSVFRDEPRNVTLSYDGQGDVTASVTPPPEQDDREPVPPDLRRGTLDPLTAVLGLLAGVGRGEGCERTLPVYDGRRRYDMVFSEVGRRIVDQSRFSVFAGVALQCRVSYRPVAGYPRSASSGRFWQRNDRAERPPVDLWLAPVAAGAPPLPVRLETESDFGSVVLHLTGVTPPAAAPRPAGPPSEAVAGAPPRR
ncbi:DUF3108 domain-containing protein [Azospirillum sp. TSO35-2]|uniref:DUF3108 domain-containing protein n=1 Tax=Azospirillum sp. TSO35-2 TaxID=716796 RepID=UPI001FFEF822|nr:DUF3108 domain-containing protein [Azospirillum sp. TSO35-2]